MDDTTRPDSGQPSPTRTCPHCKRTLPLTLEYFFKRSGNRSHQWQSWCRDCRREISRNEPPQARQEREKKYREKNRERLMAYKRSWSEGNKEKVLQYAKSYRDKQLAIDPHWHATTKRRMKKLHPETTRAADHRRRAREVNASGSHTPADILAQFTRQKGRCFWCGKKVGKDYQVDHVTPLSKGGSNSPENLVIACPKCNRDKWDKHPMDWNGTLL